jgi:hypothetical protein
MLSFGRFIVEVTKQRADWRSFISSVLSMAYSSGGYQDSPQEKKIQQLLKKNGFTKASVEYELENNQYWYQPNGRNKSPDFTLKYKNKIVNIECKSSKGAKPMYNGGLPDPEYIYIFSSEVYNETTVYRGSDIISTEEYKKYKLFSAALQKYAAKHLKKRAKENGRGFGYYVRHMYVQRGEQDKTDYFSHKDRKRCEQRVLSIFG